MTNNHTTLRTSEIDNARTVDTEIARMWGEFHLVSDKIIAARKEVERVAGCSYMKADRKAIVTDRAEVVIAELAPLAGQLYDAAVAYDEANYTGWQRFFLVKHIHSNRYCSSFRMTTRVGWLPNVSGLTEAEAVATHGETLCTICFPSAPTELTTKAVDPTICTGGRDYDAPSRCGFYSGNWGTCTCGQRQSVMVDRLRPIQYSDGRSRGSRVEWHHLSVVFCVAPQGSDRHGSDMDADAYRPVPPGRRAIGRRRRVMDNRDAEARLKWASLGWENFEGADLFGADLSGVNLSGVNLAGASYDSETIWPAGIGPLDGGDKC